MAKSCKKGYYYCYTSKKCKKIPKGYHVMPTGMLMRDSEHKDEETNGKKKNGNGANGDGNGNGDSSGSSDGGGVSEAWSAKYKRSIDCDNPKGFSQRAHCQGRKKVTEEKKEGCDHEVVMARKQVKKSIDNLKKLARVLAKKSECDDLPAWVQAKLTDTEHNTDAAAGYMDEAVSKKDKLKEISKQLAGASKMHAQQSRRVAAVANDLEEAKKCWKGYEKKGTQKLFGKTYNRCVKKEETCPICNEDPCQCLEGTINEARKSGDYSLRDWFTKSRASDGTPGWVQLGGKYAGKPCAKQPGQKTKPKCGSSKMASELSDKEEESAFRRKNRQDKNPNRRGKAKNVATEKKKKLNADYSNWRAESEQLNEFLFGPKTVTPKDSPTGTKSVEVGKKYPARLNRRPVDVTYDKQGNKTVTPMPAGRAGLMQYKYGSTWGMPQYNSYEPESEMIEGKQYQVGDPIPDSATKPKPRPTGAARYKFGVDKTGLTGPEKPLEEGKKDACYKKVKSRYKIWPSAYASGALVKCRKVGAANWGNSTNEGYDFSNWRDDFQALEFETINIIEAEPLKNVNEDWQSVNRKDKTDGMSQKAVDAYKRENPGSKLKTAVTEKNPTGKRAERRKNFCSRSDGQRKMHNIDCSKTPEKKICKARKRWRC